MGRKADQLDILAKNFARDTQAYWAWLAAYCDIDIAAKETKPAKMREPLGFLRGSFYFWRRLLAAADAELLEAPEILGVGDMHVENFGVWRDAEGRIVWGVNDFDDATRLPFASDVVRLATSAALATLKGVELKPRKAAKTIITAYIARLGVQPVPYVLEDRHNGLRDLATADGEAAVRFWKKLESEQEIDPAHVPARAHELLLRALPPGSHVLRTVAPRSGTGSLGRPRYAVLAEYRGGYVAREIKAAAPSSWSLDRTDVEDPTADYCLLERNAIRVRDPFVTIEPRWTIRRLSPESHKIEIDALQETADWKTLLQAMGGELANIHLGSAPTIAPICAWLNKREDVLIDAALQAAEFVTELAALVASAVKR